MNQPTSPQLFSPDYTTARQRFLDAANEVAASIKTHKLSSDVAQKTLAIDVATVGDDEAPTVLVSSGLHGVEGFFGSAIQLAILHELNKPGRTQTLDRVRVVLVHALNPYGFAQVRRVNEDNIDLNRNFLTEPEEYHGAPTAYARLNGLLNPTHPPKNLDLFYAQAMWVIARHGLQAMKQAVAGGQYEYPRGLFFGGKGPAETVRILEQECDAWIGQSKRVVHIDLHSGLGPFATYKLLLNASEDANKSDWYAETFGGDCLESLDVGARTAYRISGMFGEWMQRRFKAKSVNYSVVGAEFGTYSVLRVLAALRRENQAHHYAETGDSVYSGAKTELLECFCPANPKWRHDVVTAGIQIFEQAAVGILPPP